MTSKQIKRLNKSRKYNEAFNESMRLKMIAAKNKRLYKLMKESK